MLFDTGEVSAAQDIRLFGNTNVGDRELTNLQVPGRLAGNDTALIESIGVRVLGQSKSAEMIILGYVNLTFTLGDMPQFELTGPCLSTLIESQPRGYELRKGVIIPVRQHFSVHVRGSRDLVEPVRLKVILHGVGSRESGY